MRAEIVYRRRTVLGPVLCVAAAALLVASVPAAHAQANLAGHIGFVLPLVTHAGGQTTNISDHFSIGFPLGITFKGKGRMAYDLELVPGVQGTPRQTNLTVHPGFVWNVGHNFGAGLRGAFDINSPQWGFTPLVKTAGRSRTTSSRLTLLKRFYQSVLIGQQTALRQHQLRSVCISGWDSERT